MGEMQQEFMDFGEISAAIVEQLVIYQAENISYHAEIHAAIKGQRVGKEPTTTAPEILGSVSETDLVEDVSEMAESIGNANIVDLIILSKYKA